MKNIVIVLIVFAMLAAAWFFVSPLFIDRTVNESFDVVLSDGRLDMDRIMAMSDDERLGMMGEIMDSAADAPDVEATDPMPEEQPAVILRGSFIDADAIHKGSGTATVYALPNGTHVVRFEDFRTTNGPALVVYLAEHPSPASAADVSDNGFLSIGKLKGNVGNQNYIVPADIDISRFNSVVIWCELFGVLFSPAALTPI